MYRRRISYLCDYKIRIRHGTRAEKEKIKVDFKEEDIDINESILTPKKDEMEESIATPINEEEASKEIDRILEDLE